MQTRLITTLIAQAAADHRAALAALDRLGPRREVLAAARRERARAALSSSRAPLCLS